jgi:hypothetical protein
VVPFSRLYPQSRQRGKGLSYLAAPSFHIQHHWVTNSGDNILFDPAIATTQPISQTLFAVITYKAIINSDTGKFAGATGELNITWEADTVNGTAFRYYGEACFADAD